jgi:hypothetical protein
MSTTLTQLISRVQSLLGDTNALFPASTYTAAIRQALAEINHRAPQILSLAITGENDQYIYDLTAEDPNAIRILDVLLQGHPDTPITYDDYTESEHIRFRLRQPVTTSDTLLIRYTAPHTIAELDQATESTLPTQYEQMIVSGAAYWAIHIRATSRVEMINMSDELAGNYAQAMQAFRSAFDMGLAEAARRRAPTGEPDPRAWNDPYHNWDQ